MSLIPLPSVPKSHPCPICYACEGPYPGPPRSGITIKRDPPK